MKQLKVFFALLLLACSAAASAQDFIIKADGSAIACRIVEVSATEIVYKRWTDLQGSNYVMNRADAASIKYEHAASTATGEVVTPSPANAGQKPNDMDLLAIDRQIQEQKQRELELQRLALTPQNKQLQKAYVLRKIGWIGGITLFAGGICLDAIGFAMDEPFFYVPGLIGGTLGSAVWTTVFLGSAKHVEKKAYTTQIQSNPLWQNQYNFENGASFAAGVDVLQDRHTNTLGLGLRYTF